MLSFIQHVTEPPDSQKNYLVVDQKTEDSTIAGAFEQFTMERKDIAILLINQHVRSFEKQDLFRDVCWSRVLIAYLPADRRSDKKTCR